jgi:pimeloyl-ACP methyl ester carboxylesterase
MSAGEGRLLAANGVQLWVEPGARPGDDPRPPVLLIAGLGYATWCWHELRAQLGREFALTAFDNRGAGRSDKPPGPYSIAQLADDAAAVLDGLGLASVAVLGHSMGGYIALTLALRHPRKVRSLVLVGTSPGGPATQPTPAATLATWQLAGTMSPQEYARASMPKSFAPGWTEAHPQAFEDLLARRLRFPTPGPSWLAQYQACVEYVTQGAPVERIAAKALVIHGEQDQVVVHANGKLLAQRLPHARFVTLPDAGHLPFLEDPPGFAELVRGHLRGT